MSDQILDLATGEQPTRNILIKTMRGDKKRFILESKATTKAELDAELRNLNIEPDNLSLVLSKTKHTVEHPEATLPSGDFKAFLLPQKGSRLGLSIDEIESMNKTALKAKIKELCVDKTAKAYFRGYSSLSIKDLRSLLTVYFDGKTIVAEEVEEEKPAKKTRKSKTTKAVATTGSKAEGDLALATLTSLLREIGEKNKLELAKRMEAVIKEEVIPEVVSQATSHLLTVVKDYVTQGQLTANEDLNISDKELEKIAKNIARGIKRIKL